MQKARGGECVGGDCGEVEEDQSESRGSRMRGSGYEETGRPGDAILRSEQGSRR
jgi:hypothetical protein